MRAMSRHSEACGLFGKMIPRFHRKLSYFRCLGSEPETQPESLTMEEKAMPATSRLYFPQVDGLRFVAFFLVLIHHYTRLSTLTSAEVGFVRLIARIQEFGWIGVDIFLVLSSFLIFSLLLEERSRTGRISMRRFYIRRALRIWPLYFPFLLFGMLVVPLLIGTKAFMGQTIHQHLLTFMTFTGNFSYAYFPGSLTQFFAHLWTISLEEQFYFFVPLLVFFGASLRHRALWLAGFGMLLTMAFRWYVLSNNIAYPMVWVNPACRLDPFIMGGVAALVLRRKKNWLEKPLGWAWGLAALAGFALVLSFPGIGSSLHTCWQLSMVSISGFCLVMAVLSPRGLGRSLAWGYLPYLGKISFGLYVYHESMLFLAGRLHLPVLLHASTFGGWLGELVVILLASIFVSTISYQFYERRFLKLKERFEVVRARPA